jgi:hypothetical protein
MGGILETLLQVFELLLQGALALFVLAYLLNTQKRWRCLLSMFYRRLIALTFETLQINTWREPVQLILVLGLVYFFGIISNLTSFLILRPAHEQIIHEVSIVQRTVAFATASGASPCDACSDSAITAALRKVKAIDSLSTYRRAVPFRESTIRELCWLPIRDLAGIAFTRHAWTDNIDAAREPIHYAEYVREEVNWKNRRPDAEESSLGALLKQIRVARTTATAAFVTALLAVCRLLISLVGWVILKFQPGLLPAFDRRFVRNDEGEYWTEKKYDLPSRESKVVKNEIQHNRWTSIVVLMSALIIYYCSVGAYKVGEWEYHLMVGFGCETAERMPPASK